MKPKLLVPGYGARSEGAIPSDITDILRGLAAGFGERAWGLRMSWQKRLPVFKLMLLMVGCDFHVPGVDETFGKQNFVSAVSMIELHKTRHGGYPDTLQDLQYLGDWDSIWLSAVRYEKVHRGYNLYVEQGWAGEPDLAFPIGFKKGLGLRDSNVKWVRQ